MHTLTFSGVDPTGADNTAFIDKVALNTTSPSAGLLDGGFELTSVGPSQFQYDPIGLAWTFSSGAGVSSNGSGFTAGNPVAPEGTHVAFLQQTGNFSQSATFAAGTYTLSFAAAQRGNFQASSQTIEVLVDGTVVGRFTPAGTSYATLTSNAFTLTAGLHTVEFLGLDPNGGDNTAFVDKVALNIASPSAGLLDGGFELTSVGPTQFQYDPTGLAWSFNGSAGVSSNNSGFTAGNPVAPEGSHVAFLQQTGSFNESATFAAGTYTLSFAAAQRGNFQASSQTFEVLVDGAVVGRFTPVGTNYATLTSNAFTLTAGLHTVEFLGLDPSGGDNTAFIDNVRLV